MSTSTAPTSLKTLSLCVFCFAETGNASKEIEIKTEEYWPYIQPRDWSVSEQAPLQTLPMCLNCSRKIEKVAKCHREIVELEQRLDAVRKLLDKAVGGVQEAMEKVTTAEKKNKSLQSLKTSARRLKGVKRRCQEMMGSFNVTEIEESEGDSTTGSSTSRTTKSKSDITVKKAKVNSSSSIVIVASSPSTSREVGLQTKAKNNQRVQDPVKHSISVNEELAISSSHSDNENNPDFTFKLEQSSSESEYDAPTEPESSQDVKDPLELEEESFPSKQKRLPHSSKKRTKPGHNVRLCVICGSKHSLCDLYKHMKSHVGEFAFQCPGCSFTFPSRLSHAYFDTYHRTKCRCRSEISIKIDCELCDKKARPGFAFRHFETHETSEKNHSCPMPSCGKAFTWKQTLELHLGNHEIRKAKKIKKLQNSSTLNSRRSRQCEICGEKLSFSLSVLKEHMVSHVGEYAFQCPQEKCQLTFASRYSRDCLTHRTVHGKYEVCDLDLPKICEECKEEFDHFRDLKSHLQRHEIAQEKNFKCPMKECVMAFTIKQSLEYHIGTHAFQKTLQICPVCKLKMTPDKIEHHLTNVHGAGAEEIVKCGYCPFVFHTQENYMEHLMNHVRSCGVRCHLCSSEEVYRNGGNLRRHFFQEHQIGREYLCESCDYSAFSLATLKNHKAQVHEGRHLYTCQICEDKPKFTTAQQLATHRIQLHGEEKFKCQFCTESFITKQTLYKHEKQVHRGVEFKTFPCSKCDMVFKRNDALKNHLEIMHSEEEYHCEKCGKSYRTKVAHKNHVKRCNAGANLVCETCGKGFKEKSILQTHMRIHTGERPYLCKLCGMRFRQQSTLYRHSKAHERKGDQFVPKGSFEKKNKKKINAHHTVI